MSSRRLCSRSVRSSVMFILFLLAIGPALAGESVGSAKVFLGMKRLDSGFSPDLDIDITGPELGVDLMVGRRRWPLQIAVNVLVSEGKKDITYSHSIHSEMELSILEAGIGICKEWQGVRFRPAICGGPLYAFARYKEYFPDNYDYQTSWSGLGGWLMGSFEWRLGPRFDLGAELRYSKVEVGDSAWNSGYKVEAGGFHAGLLVGWGWPAGR